MSGEPKIVLTADATMMSKYRGGIFFGFSTCMPTGIVPDWLYFKIIAPPVPRESRWIPIVSKGQRRARYADFGLRIIEASLVENGFSEEEVAVVHPKDIDKVVGSDTEIVGIGGHDLLGMNPPTSEFVDLLSTGPPYNRLKFLELLDKPALDGKTIVVGGKSAWQLADEKIMDRLGIDHVHLGEGEKSVPRMMKDILEGKDLPPIIEAEEIPEVEDIPNIRGGTIHGLVEIMRGCGRGCKFCTPTMQKLRIKPIEKILRDVKTNLEAGEDSPLLHSEDVLRYGTKGVEPNGKKVTRLFKEIAKIDGVKEIGTSHIALATAYHNPKLVEKVSEICFTLPEQDFIGTQTGIETGSPRLIDKYMRGKALPSDPEDWPEICEQAMGILNDNDWIPACTIVNGLPGEERDDVVKTLELIDDLKGTDSLLVPLSFVSMEGSHLSAKRSFRSEDMTPEHWQVLGNCIEHTSDVAREQIEERDIGNPLTRWIFKGIINYIIEHAEDYASELKRGRSPSGFDEGCEDYTIPEVLNA